MPDSTRERILDLAQSLTQTRGYNGFSYADIASALKIQKASVHHHFATKAELGKAMLERYREGFGKLLQTIDQKEKNAPEKLKRYAKAFSDTLKEDNRMCVCGMLAADFTTLPKGVRDGVKAFFDDNEKWLERVLEQGRKQRQLKFEGKANIAARRLLSSLEGAMLVARSYQDPTRFDSVAQPLLSVLAA